LIRLAKDEKADARLVKTATAWRSSVYSGMQTSWRTTVRLQNSSTCVVIAMTMESVPGGLNSPQRRILGQR
jgi:hypothetical protein